jgi:hypothetical protein
MKLRRRLTKERQARLWRSWLTILEGTEAERLSGLSASVAEAAPEASSPSEDDSGPGASSGCSS